MTIAHGLPGAGDVKRHRAAEAASNVRQEFSFRDGPAIAAGPDTPLKQI